MRSSAAYTGSTMNGSQTYEKTSHIAQFVYAMFWSGRPSPFSAQLSAPSCARIVRHA